MKATTMTAATIVLKFMRSSSLFLPLLFHLMDPAADHEQVPEDPEPDHEDDQQDDIQSILTEKLHVQTPV
jgi:hypothetical protein